MVVIFQSTVDSLTFDIDAELSDLAQDPLKDCGVCFRLSQHRLAVLPTADLLHVRFLVDTNLRNPFSPRTRYISSDPGIKHHACGQALLAAGPVVSGTNPFPLP